ncbi:MAG: hypothetical protein LQ340_006473 [Diploschistes diacapsis]|nr:MAG: hypothetical protein LQ340_006473 [Diploschistes diacapsis]
MSAGTLHRTIPTSAPVSVPRKPPQSSIPLYSRQAPVTRVGTSPSSAGSSVNSSAVPSLTNGSRGNASTVDTETSSGGARGVDLIEMMTDRLQLNPEPMDRSIAKQAQTSGELNAKQRELAELQALAQRRLKATRANIADGMKAAKEVKKDLAWTQKKVT